MYMLDKRINKFEIYGQYKHDDTLLCNCRVSIVAFETIFGIILTIKIIYKQAKNYSTKNHIHLHGTISLSSLIVKYTFK